MGPAIEASIRRRVRLAAAEAVLREGGVVRIHGPDHPAVDFIALDGAGTAAALAFARSSGPTIRMVLTGARARALGLDAGSAVCVALAVPSSGGTQLLETLAGMPASSRRPIGLPTLVVEPATPAEAAAIDIAKRASLLPVLMVVPGSSRQADAVVEISKDDIDTDPMDAPLVPIVQADLPISLTETARVVAFRAPDVAYEHVALVVGKLDGVSAPLVRLHSECMTGDVFGSLRCDCGPQLQAALSRMAQDGAGVLLYLRQEGRGIGLTNKLRAYRLQEMGLDTLDANTHLGFEQDERDFRTAARMLQALGLHQVRLLTNNPEKVHTLGRHGVTVTERVPLSIAANRHNLRYLQTKRQRAGHLGLPAVNDEEAG
ncbi:GTP cyclohydrolase II [Geminicoccus roseus]|uniref:GTP cyclohydrolase II n=1 Tax=Geminicoccus roseus TaxID=404900 RepID=UPI000427381A|nr:GTP cyclohydrolase II [Geminicoccus roseus]